MKADASLDRNRRILRWAWVVGGLVLIVGLLVIVAPAVRHSDTLFDDPFGGQVERRTVETFDPTGDKTGTEVTTEPAGSWLERSLGPGGVLLLRLAVVAVAAFLAVALVYRTASGSFPLEVAGVRFAEETSAGLDELTGTVATLAGEVESLNAEVERLRNAVAEGVGTVADLAERVDVVEEQDGLSEDAVLGIATRLSQAISDLDELKADVAKERLARRRSPKAQ